MITKPQGWDTAAAYTDDFEVLPAGGYVCGIKQAKKDFSQSGKEMLVLCLDIAEGEYAGYFQRQFDSMKEKNPDAKWGCVFRQLTSSVSFFKGLTTCIQASNQGYTWNFDESTLQNKLVGMLFGREQYMNSKGETKWRTTPKMARTVAKIRDGEYKIPEDKVLSNVDVFANVPMANSSDLPF